MSSLNKCATCNKSYRVDQLAYCPHCGTEAAAQGRYSVVDSTSSRSFKAKSNEPKNLSPQAIDLNALIRAQNRTTHAIRSLNIFIFTTLLSSLIGLTMIFGSATAQTQCRLENAFNQSACNENSVATLGVLAIFVGFIVAFWLGLQELDKSRVN
jgi:DNA-directed RNA polymerase subunit RPC12/RpoP